MTQQPTPSRAATVDSAGDSPSGARGPRPGDLDETLAVVTEIARLLEMEFDSAELRQAIREGHERGQEPLEVLQRLAPALGLSVHTTRMPTADAVWIADDHLPIVAWGPTRGEWLVIRRHGFFQARVWSSVDAASGAATVSRRALARRLGLRSAGDRADFAIVQPLLPAAKLADPGHAHHGALPHRPHARGHAAAHAHGHHAVSPVRRLLSLMRRESPELWTIVIFSAVTGLMYLALPLAVNAFVSNLSFGTQSGPFMQGLVALAAVLFVCLAVAAALRMLQHSVAEVIQRRIFVRLGADLAHRLPHVDIEALDGVHGPELVNRFLDVITVQKSASMLLLTGINLLLSAVIGLTVLAFYHPYLLAFSLALVVALGCIVFIAGRRAVATSIEESRWKYQVVDWMQELARHPRVFKGAGGAEFAKARADDLVRGYLNARRGHFTILMRQIGGLLLLEVLAASALLVVGGWLVLSQQITLGQLVASEIIVSAIVASISKLGKQFEAWYDAVAAMDKLGHLVDLPLEREDGEVVEPRGLGAAVEVRGLAYSRFGRSPAFSDLSFAIAPGERVALLGSRGSGTSSVLEILLGMRAPLAGQVLVDGLDTRAWNLPALRGRACILRSTDIIAGTIAENIRLGVDSFGGKSMTTAELQAAVEASGLGEAIRTLPDGLETTLVTGGLPLTGRQRARLLAARALAAKPNLLLLDEILDGHEGTLDTLAKVLIDAPHPWTVIVATRDPRVAARCTRTIEIASSASANPREVTSHA
jgi:ABC-type bacteriocin/lantibiotic exporter with double-glycine peptidase domain